MNSYLLIALLGGLAALLFAFVKSNWIKSREVGDARMAEIAGYIRTGAMAFLGREYRVLGIFVVIVAVVLGVVNGVAGVSSSLVSLSFVVGAVCSGLAGFFGMRVATLANVRTTQAARTSLPGALAVAFSGGSVMGMVVVGLGVSGLAGLFFLYTGALDFAYGTEADLQRLLSTVTGFSLGASSIALFARVGGGIYTKAADVGADLVGKVEAGIPEDDPRNPAVIADNVGDNVGDVAGMGADLFESYVGAIVGTMVLGAFYNLNLVILPLILAAVGIGASILGTFAVRMKEGEGGNPQAALNLGSFGAAAIMLLVSYPVIKYFLPQAAHFTSNPTNTLVSGLTPGAVFLALVIGLVAGVAIGLFSEYYTAEARRPARNLAGQAKTGAATVVIAGLGLGMLSTALPILTLGAGIYLAYHLAGLYGIAIAGLGMLSTTGIQLAVDAYGPIADNSGGIAEMCHLPKEVRARTDKLDAVGNTTAAIGKGFAIGSAALTALALFSAFQATAGVTTIDVSKPDVMTGLLIGAMLPFLFGALAMRAVGNAAYEMVEEVRRQFREITGLLEGTGKADYARCVDISTAAAIKRMVVPGSLAVVAPILFGWWSAEALGGFLAGATASGVMLAIFMANAGGAWDNAKKHIEGGAYGGKGSDAHKAAVVGDTVGDPFKDTAGPSMNILIKLMSVVALVIAPLLR
ncbi:MAG: sodium-translocating pyrophosphatase [Calditrichaeota bacterium]|nr:sodium-translocating pyrophosphatase [Calditrichota bacterium]